MLFSVFCAKRPVALLLDGCAGEIDCPDEIGVELEEPIIVEAHDVVGVESMDQQSELYWLNSMDS